MNRKEKRLAVEVNDALSRFLSEFVALEELGTWVNQVDLGGRRYLVPAGHANREEFERQVSRVNLAAPAAAQALEAIGTQVAYKPSGSWDRFKLNPVAAWSQLLASDPMFTRDELVMACQMALGSVSPSAQRVAKLAGSQPNSNIARLATAVLGVWKWGAGVSAGVAISVITALVLKSI